MSTPRQTRIAFRNKKIQLEGVLGTPEEASLRIPGVVVCHPEPHLGGSMESVVVQSICRGLNERGIITLRFNFRGVGESEGTYNLGVGELEDARAALKTLRGWPSVDGKRIGIVGYSFGGGIAFRAALRERSLLASAVVSPPLTVPPVGLQLISNPRADQRPLLFVIGEKDGLTAPAALREWVENLGKGPRMVVIPGADRSWQGRGAELASEVGGFFGEVLR